MNATSIFKTLEKRIRLSKSYANWVTRNKAATCLCCGTSEHLECHHVVELYHILLGLWKLYGDEEQVYAHAIAMHDDDRCECATLCNDCHNKRHKARIPRSEGEIYIDEWTVIPRNFDLRFVQSTKKKGQGELGLIGFQTLLGIGWYILHGHLDSRMITFNRRNFARLLDKEPSTSFNNSLNIALDDLKIAGVLIASHTKGNDIELHLSDEYLDMMGDNPWFIPFGEMKTHKPCILALKWFLGTQTKRALYRISLDKLMKHIGIQTVAPQMVTKALRMACKRIRWAKVSVDKGLCTFTLKKRPSTPIFSLRSSLNDALQKGR